MLEIFLKCRRKIGELVGEGNRLIWEVLESLLKIIIKMKELIIGGDVVGWVLGYEGMVRMFKGKLGE